MILKLEKITRDLKYVISFINDTKEYMHDGIDEELKDLIKDIIKDINKLEREVIKYEK